MSSFRRILLITLALGALGVYYIHRRIHSYDRRILTETTQLETGDWPRPRVAVVFGASVYGNGELSPILEDRVATAIDLYRLRKVDKILVSGDNRQKNYNEPKAMQEYLVTHAVAPKDVLVDYEGRSTYETCLRAKETFKLDRAVLVSQGFHLSRALYIANHLGLDSVGMAGDLRQKQEPDYQGVREWAAEVKAFFVLHFAPPAVSQ